jgi:xanthine dehydrogenase accessory factor
MNDYLQQALALQRAGKAFVLATVVRAERPTSARPGAKAIVTADGEMRGWVGGSCAQPSVIREALKALSDGQPRLLRLCPAEQLGRAPQTGTVEVALTCISGGTLEVYIEPHLPKPVLLVVGHLPVVEALSALAKGLNYEIAVVGLDATRERFPQADTVLDRLDFAHFDPDEHTYVVVASHGNYDEEALEWALNTRAGYVALVASPRRGESVRAYLRDSGLSDAQLARLKCPAGLDLGASQPEEIALSILAEIVQSRRRQQASVADGTEPVPQPAAEAPAAPAEARDPVCGMMVEVATARYTSQYAGQMYYFCAAGCRRLFEKEPAKYLVNT